MLGLRRLAALRRPFAVVLGCTLGCGAPPGAGESAPPPAGACASAAPDEMPRAVLVEQRLPACDLAVAARGEICLEELDGAGFAVVSRADVEGRVERLAGDRAAGVEASDPRALHSGGYRYARSGGDGAVELVTVDAAGRERATPGAAARPMLLGGRSFADPSDRAGRLRAEVSLDDRASVRLVDATRGDAELAVLRLDGATPLERSAHVADGGGRFGILAREGDDVVWLVRNVEGGRERRVIADAAAAPLAVDDELRWLAIPSAVRGVVVSGPDRSHTVPVSPAAAAAFDPCGRWLYIVGGRGPQLLRLELRSGELEHLGSVPRFVERLEPTPDGALLIGSSLPGGVTGAPRAIVLSPFDGRSVEIPLPDGTERVSDAVVD